MNEVKLYLYFTPKRIKVNNGSELINKNFDIWLDNNNVFLDFSRHGRLKDNP
jgi:hypothetical protein